MYEHHILAQTKKNFTLFILMAILIEHNSIDRKKNEPSPSSIFYIYYEL